MNCSHDVLHKVMGLLRNLDKNKRVIGPQTQIFVELDFDSLQMLDLLETLKRDFGVDFFLPPYSLADLRTPETLAKALCQHLKIPLS